MNLSRKPSGMTAIEVLASTLLAALLMTALLGVLRGLKAQEHALELRTIDPPWKAMLDAVLAADLANARTYLSTPQSLTLQGFGGRNTAGASNWLPSTVVYSVQSDGMTSWLVRRELAAVGGAVPQAPNLVLAGVQEIRIGVMPSDSTADLGATRTPPAAAPPVGVTPMADGLVVELWTAASNEPLYRYRHHAP